MSKYFGKHFTKTLPYNSSQNISFSNSLEQLNTKLEWKTSDIDLTASVIQWTEHIFPTPIIPNSATEVYLYDDKNLTYTPIIRRGGYIIYSNGVNDDYTFSLKLRIVDGKIGATTQRIGSLTVNDNNIPHFMRVYYK